MRRTELGSLSCGDLDDVALVNFVAAGVGDACDHLLRSLGVQGWNIEGGRDYYHQGELPVFSHSRVERSSREQTNTFAQPTRKPEGRTFTRVDQL